MITPEELIKIQDEFSYDPEELYQEFKSMLDKAIQNLPNYVKEHKDAEYYPMPVFDRFRKDCQDLCDRYIQESLTKFQIYPNYSSYVYIRWRGKR